jgi:hypothetical protein
MLLQLYIQTVLTVLTMVIGYPIVRRAISGPDWTNWFKLRNLNQAILVSMMLCGSATAIEWYLGLVNGSLSSIALHTFLPGLGLPLFFAGELDFGYTYL